MRGLSALQSKLEDKCRSVEAYETSGRAKELEEMKAALQETADSVAEQGQNIKVWRDACLSNHSQASHKS